MAQTCERRNDSISFGEKREILNDFHVLANDSVSWS